MAIYIIGKLKQKNDGKFALLDAADVEMPDGKRLSEVGFLTNDSLVPITQEAYNDLTDAEKNDPSKYYFIKKEA